MILTSRFLNLLQGRLALMNREVWALVFASLCGKSDGFRGLEHKQAGRNIIAENILKQKCFFKCGGRLVVCYCNCKLNVSCAAVERGAGVTV